MVSKYVDCIQIEEDAGSKNLSFMTNLKREIIKNGRASCDKLKVIRCICIEFEEFRKKQELNYKWIRQVI